MSYRRSGVRKRTIGVVDIHQTEQAEVWVYQYTYWDARTNTDRTSALFATGEMINLGLGKAVPSSAMKVSVHDVTDGIYTPQAKKTGQETCPTRRTLELDRY